MRVVIELDISVDPEPDTGVGVENPEDSEEVKNAVYSYLQELIEDDSLAFRIEE